MPSSKYQTTKNARKNIKPEAARAKSATVTKTRTLLNMLSSKRGASIEQLQKATGWQAHSVRGFLSGTVKKKLGLALSTKIGKDGRKRYRIESREAHK